MSQKEIFKSCESDAWFHRNINHCREIARDDDPIISTLANLKYIEPKRLLEIGACTGYRLARLKEIYEAEVYGIEPSLQAVNYGNKKFDSINLNCGTADDLKFEDCYFQCVIFGFCLYLCDREDLFKIAYEVDRVLEDKGYIIIYDFLTPFPYSKEYQHHKEVLTYKMNHSEMFNWHPYYQVVYEKRFDHHCFDNIPSRLDNQVGISVLKKDRNILQLIK